MVEDPSNWKIGLESIFDEKCVWQLKRKVCLAIGLVMHHRGGAVFSKRENTAEHGNNEVNTDHFDFIRIIIVILNRDYHCHLKNQAAKPSAEFFAPVWIFHGNLLLDCKDASSLPTPDTTLIRLCQPQTHFAFAYFLHFRYFGFNPDIFAA